MSYMPERPWSEPEDYKQPPPAPPPPPTYNYFVSSRTFFRAGLFWAFIGFLALWAALVAFEGIAAEFQGKHVHNGAWTGIAASLGPFIWLGCWFLAYRAFRNWAEFKRGQMSLLYGRR